MKDVEDRLIITASRTKLNSDDIGFIEEASSNGVDWKGFERKAILHKVGTLIYYSLKKHDLLKLLPVDLSKRFHHDYVRLAVENSKLFDEIDIISEIVGDNIVILKGADLATSLYPNIALRSMCDIDILVEKERVIEVWNKLRLQGYYSPLAKSSVHLKVLWHKGKHLQDLYNGKYKIDVHYNLFNGSDHYHITKLALGNTLAVDSSKRLYRLSDTFQLIYLCSHFCSHLMNGGSHLRRLCDINELLSKPNNTINWNQVDILCENSFLLNRISIALNYASAVFQTVVPANLYHENMVTPASIDLSSFLKSCSLEEKFLDDLHPKSNIETLMNGIDSLNNPFDKLTLIYRTIVPERKWIHANYSDNSNRADLKSYSNYWSYLINAYLKKSFSKNDTN